MRTKYIFMLTISVVLMTSQAFASCVNNADGDKTYPIGDRAIYDAVGNVKSIEQGYSKTEFDENGMEVWPGMKNRTITKTSDGFEVRFESYNYYTEEMEETVWTYDKEGRTSGAAGKYNIKYDSNNHVISYMCAGDDGPSSEVTYTYGSDGFLQKSVMVEKDDWGNVLGTSTTTYKVLAKDSHGNWTKRQNSEGTIEERKIEYYQ